MLALKITSLMEQGKTNRIDLASSKDEDLNCKGTLAAPPGLELGHFQAALCLGGSKSIWWLWRPRCEGAVRHPPVKGACLQVTPPACLWSLLISFLHPIFFSLHFSLLLFPWQPHPPLSLLFISPLITAHSPSPLCPLPLLSGTLLLFLSFFLLLSFYLLSMCSCHCTYLSLA